MNGTLLGKLEQLMQLFQKHKPMFEECLLKMQQKRRLALLAVGFSRGIIACFGVASLICTLLEATLVMAPIGMLNIGFAVGVNGGQALLQLAKEYRKQLKSESALACRSMHGTTTAIHELAELQDKIKQINVRIPLHPQLLRVIKIINSSLIIHLSVFTPNFVARSFSPHAVLIQVFTLSFLGSFWHYF
jgi:hypothetical protein